MILFVGVLLYTSIPVRGGGSVIIDPKTKEYLFAGSIIDFDTHLKEYNTEIYNFSCERWKELGKPLSLSAHQAKKKRLDAEDDYKDKYCDR